MTIKRGSEFFLSKTSKFWVLFCCQKRQKFWGFFMGVKAELTKKEKKKKKQVYLLKLYIYLLITKKREKSAKKPHEFGANYWFPPIFSIKSQFSPKPFSSFQVTIPASFFPSVPVIASSSRSRLRLLDRWRGDRRSTLEFLVFLMNYYSSFFDRYFPVKIVNLIYFLFTKIKLILAN
jgi:hypothetical protein